MRGDSVGELTSKSTVDASTVSLLGDQRRHPHGNTVRQLTTTLAEDKARAGVGGFLLSYPIEKSKGKEYNSVWISSPILTSNCLHKKPDGLWLGPLVRHQVNAPHS